MKAIRHIPHDSTVIPDDYREQFTLTDTELHQERLRMTASHTLALFGRGAAADVVFPVSRLLVDVERFEDDAQEPMVSRGMGVLYSRTHDRKPLRRELSKEEREELLAKYYRPHHALLQQRVDDSLDTEGVALVIDCHSFPSQRLPYEIGDEGSRPEICIGTDSFHTPPQLREAAVEGFREAGFSVDVDKPFAGAITPLKHYGEDKRVMALMIEVRRDLYMDEEAGEKSSRFDDVRGKVQTVIEGLEAVVAAPPVGTALKDEYRNVRFRCGPAEVPQAFFILTAHNPAGVTVDDHANQQADDALQASIGGLGLSAFPVTGGDADFTHAEPGYGIPCARDQALRLARQFHQDAVFEVRGDRVFLVSALEAPVPDAEIGRWSELCDKIENVR